MAAKKGKPKTVDPVIPIAPEGPVIPIVPEGKEVLKSVIRTAKPGTSQSEIFQRFAMIQRLNINLQNAGSISRSPSGDSLSGRTPDSGTRSLLEGFRSFTGGGLRKQGK